MAAWMWAGTGTALGVDSLLPPPPELLFFFDCDDCEESCKQKIFTYYVSLMANQNPIRKSAVTFSDCYQGMDSKLHTFSIHLVTCLGTKNASSKQKLSSSKIAFVSGKQFEAILSSFLQK